MSRPDLRNKNIYLLLNYNYSMPLIPAIGFAIKFVGEVLLALSVYVVHNRVAREMKIDKRVIVQINKEKYIALIALGLIILGFLLEFPSRLTG